MYGLDTVNGMVTNHRFTAAAKSAGMYRASQLQPQEQEQRSDESADAYPDSSSFSGCSPSRLYVETDPTGRYARFEQVLGKGATKTVYKAIDEVMGMEVAWSQVHLSRVMLRSPEELQRLYSEVHLLSALNHDSIIQFYTSWVDPHRNTFNFITEMFTSGTLRQYRNTYKRVDIQAIKNWARQILRGLVYLHGQNPPIIHRDLKCDNVFVNGHLGQVKIGDLGLAAVLRGAQLAHSVIGTPEFMAPELYEEEYNELVDVYSFGMCLLEMLTSEYPYSECANPAQIYKKVTSGKLPAAFFRIQDPEARRLIGRCLEPASNRLPAKDLLLDPFLAAGREMLAFAPGTGLAGLQPLLNNIDDLCLSDNPYPLRTNMTITGKLNHPEDDTIFLKVQIAAKEGSVRNVYFPFDTVTDTPLSVATEMVKELDITDWDSVEISNMIDREVSTLLPQWKRWDLPHEPYHTFNYQEDDGSPRNPPCFHSSCSSSQASLSCFSNTCGTGKATSGHDWLQDDLFDDASSQSSLHTAKYSHLNYNSSNELDSGTNLARRDQHPIPNAPTRFCPEEYHSTGSSIAQNCYKQCQTLLEARGACNAKHNSGFRGSPILARNWSFVDIRSQLLHRSLVEEVNKRRFRTVGAMENIGFQAPCEVSGKTSRQLSIGSSGRTMKDN